MNFQQFESLDAAASEFNLNKAPFRYHTTDMIVVAQNDNTVIQIGELDSGNVMINPEIAKVADSLHEKLIRHHEKNKQDLKHILLELTENMVDDPGAYCLCCEPVNEGLDHIVIETKDINELVNGINQLVA